MILQRNNDGNRRVGYTAPSPVQVIEEVLLAAVTIVGYIETTARHTGLLGDAIAVRRCTSAAPAGGVPRARFREKQYKMGHRGRHCRTAEQARWLPSTNSTPLNSNQPGAEA